MGCKINNNTKQADIRKYNEPIKENIINFSHNWNLKLNCRFFTSIRSVEKLNYYMLRTREKFTVNLNKEKYCTAILHDVNVMSFKDFKTPEIFILDTGNRDFKTLFKKFGINESFVLLLFERID